MAQSILLGADVFRVWALLRDRGNGARRELIDDVWTSLSWDDASALMTGDITLQRPEFGEGVPLRKGDQVMVEASVYGQGFGELWRMRVNSPSRGIDGTQTFQLANDLDLLNRSQDDFKFAKNKAHPKGWLTGDAAKYVLDRYGVRYAPMPKTTHFIKKLTQTGVSPLSMLATIFRAERVNSGHRYVFRMDRGVAIIRPLRRTPYIMEVNAAIEDLTTSDSFRDEFATALTVRGTTGTSKRDKKLHRKVKSRKIAVSVQSNAAISQYGYVHRFYHANDIDSEADARKVGLRRIAQMVRPNFEVTMTLEGIPRLRRGDAMFVNEPDVGLHKTVWVKEVRHTVNSGEYTMDLTLMFDDPFKKT
jgi:hypothetical protein